MSDVYSNPGNASYFADLGITNRPTGALHGDVWRPHPILSYIPVVSIPRGQTGWGVKTIADWAAAIAFAENTALTDQAMPTITSTNPTLGGRGFSYSETVQGRQRVSDDDWTRWEEVRDQKVIRVMLDDLTHGATNSIILLSASVTDVTTDAASNASLDGFVTAVQAVGRPAVAFYDAVGIQGLIDSIRAEGTYWSNQGLEDQVRRMADGYQPDQIHRDGFVMELFGCRVYQTNNRTGDATRLYENSSITHGIVMSDTRRRLQASAGTGQYRLVAPPILLQGREDPIPGLPRVHEPDPQWFTIESGDMTLDALGMAGVIGIGKWFDIGNNVAGHKADFGFEADPLLTNTNDIRCHQYLTAYQS